MSDDRLRNLMNRVATLEERVRRTRALFCRTVAGLSLIGLALGFILPFLSATGSDESVHLLQAIGGLADAEGGPIESEAMPAPVVVAVFVVLILATGIAVVCVLAETVSDRTRAVTRVLAILLLIGCSCIWVLVLTLASHWNGRISWFSPAAASLTLGAVLALLAPKFTPEPWNHGYRWNTGKRPRD